LCIDRRSVRRLFARCGRRRTRRPAAAIASQCPSLPACRVAAAALNRLAFMLRMRLLFERLNRRIRFDLIHQMNHASSSTRRS
jgi:hypothetical protein